VADDAFSDLELLFLAVGALLLVFTMWWLYFERSSSDLLTSRARAFEWGYGHYFIWGAAAAVGAGIAVGVDVLTEHADVDMTVAGSAVAVPVAVYILGLWVLHDLPRSMTRARMAASPVAAAVVLLTPLTPQPILATGLVLGALLAIKLLTAPPPTDPAAA
jgi:low temperature requirement protein LtrA